MKWNEKTKEQYKAFVTMVFGGDSDYEVHLTEDEFALVQPALDKVMESRKSSAVTEGIKELING